MSLALPTFYMKVLVDDSSHDGVVRIFRNLPGVLQHKLLLLSKLLTAAGPVGSWYFSSTKVGILGI